MFWVRVIGYDCFIIGWNCNILGYMLRGDMVLEVMIIEVKWLKMGVIVSDGLR